ncbi:MAG: amino acid ABC transporter ATP-binding protein [Deltaproteobacteria bacterium]|nr:amino acid ABC transporter ATP-binding protein [Deltaproteobacteria bacterium]
MIEVQGLHKSFGRLKVLRGVDFSLTEGEIVALIGPSGSGKSTLLRCINGLEEATEGRVLIDGQDVTHAGAKMDDIRARVGFVFQSFNLFPHMSVRRNITLAPTVVKKEPLSQAEAVCADLLAKVGLSDKIDAFPNQLSGGQRQRVAIARALAMHPKYMLFDEPTSSLDPEMIGEVLAVIRQLALAGMTMAIVTHEMSFAREIASSIVFMDEGLLLEQAPPESFFAGPKNPRAAEFVAKIL